MAGKDGSRRRAPAEETVETSLDDIDHAILRVLGEDGRVSFSDLAQRINVSRATAYAHIAKLKEEGVIRSFSVQLDPRKLGFGVSAIIALNFDFHAWPAIRDQVRAMPEVEHYAFISGQFDMLVLVRARTMETIRDVVLERLTDTPGVQSTTTFFVLDELLPRPVVLPQF